MYKTIVTVDKSLVWGEFMRKQAYFSFGNRNRENNIEQPDLPLALNCTGYEVLQSGDVRVGCRLDYYILVVEQGAVKLQCAGQSTDLSAQNMIIIPPDTHYRYIAEGGCNYYWMHITGYDAERVIKNCGLPLCSRQRVNGTDRLKLLFKQLFETYSNQDDLFISESAGQVLRILSVIGRSVGSDQGGHFEDSVLYMHRHYAEPITIEQLAAREKKSVSQYRKTFTAQFGMSPKQYLINLRMSTARHLLRTTDDKVELVAKQCGYDDYHYFCRLFRKYAGCTPSEYRA